MSTADAPSTSSADSRANRLFAGAALVLLAFNLRPVVNAVGPLVPQMRDDTGISLTLTGLLVALPLVAFSLLGVFAPMLVRGIGVRATVLVALNVLTVGQLIRVGPQLWLLFLGSAIALAGVAIGNVVTPAVVRQYFPDRIGALTATYTTTLTLGGAASAGLSVPVAQAMGSWRAGLGVWAIAAALALLAWLLLGRRGVPAVPAQRGVPSAAGTVSPGRIARTRIGTTLAVYFGVQAMIAYIVFGWLPEILTDRGMTPARAAVLNATIIVVGLVPAALSSVLLNRPRRPEYVVVALAACYGIAFAGLAVGARDVHPGTPGVWVAFACAVLIGIGTAAFPIALALIALHTRTAQATTALSAFVQCGGYLMAAAGPFLFGTLHELTGSWTLPLVVITLLAIVQARFAFAAVRGGHLEDELAMP